MSFSVPLIGQDQMDSALDVRIRARLQKRFMEVMPPEDIWGRIEEHLLDGSSKGKCRSGRIAAQRDDPMEPDLTFPQAMLS